MRLSIASTTPPPGVLMGDSWGVCYSTCAPWVGIQGVFAQAPFVKVRVCSSPIALNKLVALFSVDAMAFKTVLVQLASFNRVIHVPTTGKENEREVLFKLVREVYAEWISASDLVTLQIKDEQWGEGTFLTAQSRTELFSRPL